MRIPPRWFVLVAPLLLGIACAPESGPPPDGGEAALQPPAVQEGSGVAEVGDKEAEGPLVLFVGTSLTEGLGLDDPSSQAWPARIEARIREAGLRARVRNAGLSGETSAGALRRIDWVLDEAPGVVVLETGANDGLRGLPVEQLEANLDGILERIRGAAPEARVVLVGMEAPPNLGPDYASAFREVYPRVARRWGAELVPFLLEGVAGEPELNQADRIHPTARGHERMAETAWPVLEGVLRSVGG